MGNFMAMNPGCIYSDTVSQGHTPPLSSVGLASPQMSTPTAPMGQYVQLGR